MSRDDATLLDLAEAARRIVQFKRGLDKAGFLNDLKTQAAVQHGLLILGEAVKRLSAEFRQRHTSIPWKSISGMRDRLIHGYDDVDLEVVWKAVDEGVPRLLAEVEPLLPHEDQT
jgi:uncharacterized protein with HEPN domain